MPSPPSPSFSLPTPHTNSTQIYLSNTPRDSPTLYSRQGSAEPNQSLSEDTRNTWDAPLSPNQQPWPTDRSGRDTPSLTPSWGLQPSPDPQTRLSQPVGSGEGSARGSWEDLEAPPGWIEPSPSPSQGDADRTALDLPVDPDPDRAFSDLGLYWSAAEDQPEIVLSRLRELREAPEYRQHPTYISNREQREAVVLTGFQRLEQLATYLSRVGGVDITYYAARPEDSIDQKWRSPALRNATWRTHFSRIDSEWEAIVGRRRWDYETRVRDYGIVMHPPFNFDLLPHEAQIVWNRVRNERPPRPYFMVDLPDDLRVFLDDMNPRDETYQALDCYWRRFRGQHAQAPMITHAVRELGLTGDAAIRLEILLLRHSQTPIVEEAPEPTPSSS